MQIDSSRGRDNSSMDLKWREQAEDGWCGAVKDVERVGNLYYG